jgi:hypothetical protein
MEPRDILMVLAAFVASIALAWAGTDYVVDHVVQPLVEDSAG